MPTPWLKRIRETGQLKVFNKAGAWSHAVDKALSTFNTLSFPVKLVAETKEERSADIVVILSATGKETYKHYGDEVTVDFPADLLHGKTKTLADHKPLQVFFAAIFLPGKVKDVTNDQKLAMTVHEFIHACGLDGGQGDGTYNRNQDHDSEGIMYDIMSIEGAGIIENSRPKGAKAMPPIRVGGKTRCRIQSIWGSDACTDDQ
jgi:hypothetical protein